MREEGDGKKKKTLALKGSQKLRGGKKVLKQRWGKAEGGKENSPEKGDWGGEE